QVRWDDPQAAAPTASEASSTQSEAPESHAALAQCLLQRSWVPKSAGIPHRLRSIPWWNPLTGEPYAGKPPVRFGGRGDRNQSVFPTSIFVSKVIEEMRAMGGWSRNGFGVLGLWHCGAGTHAAPHTVSIEPGFTASHATVF